MRVVYIPNRVQLGMNRLSSSMMHRDRLFSCTAPTCRALLFMLSRPAAEERLHVEVRIEVLRLLTKIGSGLDAAWHAPTLTALR